MDLIKVLLVDDHPLLLDGISDLLRGIDDIEVIGEAVNGVQAVERALELKPDIIVMDISMPEKTGLEAIKEIKQKAADIKILVLSMYDREEYAVGSIRYGAEGYLIKNSGREELLRAIRAVASGDEYYSSTISRRLIKSYLRGEESEESLDTTPEIPITKREREILSLIATGMTTKEISDELRISPRTVDTHRTNLMRKLEIRNVAGLVRFALENNVYNRNGNS